MPHEMLTPKDWQNESPFASLRAQKEWRRRRLIPFHRLGHRTVVYARKDIEKFLAARRVDAIGEGRR